MNLKMLSDQFLDKKLIALFAVFVFTSYYSYCKGLSAGKVPHEVECKKEIEYLDQCGTDLVRLQQEHVQNLIDCTTQCKIDTCKPLCVSQVTEAIESYKRLEREFKCGSDQ